MPWRIFPGWFLLLSDIPDLLASNVKDSGGGIPPRSRVN
jgi:hypothetical protein